MLVICVSLVTNIKHLFVCLLAISVPSLEKCLFKSFPHLLIGLFVFLLLRDSLSTLDTRPLPEYDLQICSPILWVIFSLFFFFFSFLFLCGIIYNIKVFNLADV